MKGFGRITEMKIGCFLIGIEPAVNLTCRRPSFVRPKEAIRLI